MPLSKQHRRAVLTHTMADLIERSLQQAIPEIERVFGATDVQIVRRRSDFGAHLMVTGTTNDSDSSLQEINLRINVTNSSAH